MDQCIIRSLKARYRLRMIQQIIKAIDAQNPILKISILDIMNMLTICWEYVTEQTI